jgi:hypothetical protein
MAVRHLLNPLSEPEAFKKGGLEMNSFDPPTENPEEPGYCLLDMRYESECVIFCLCFK